MEYFRIGDFAKICEVTIKTIRFYEVKGLLSPVYVDRYTSYRYYDQTSVERLLVIMSLKELGFTLKEIKEFNTEKINNKIISLKNLIINTQERIKKLELMKEKGDEEVKDFIDDERVIGKWKKIGRNDFPIKEIYFLPKGEKYWVISWTKGFIRIGDTEHRYEVDGDELIVFVQDCNGVEDLSVKFKRVNRKKYAINDIRVKDNVSYTFEFDEMILGNWKVIDYVKKIDMSNVRISKDIDNQEEHYLRSLIFLKDGGIIMASNKMEITNRFVWTKGRVIDAKCDMTSSSYTIFDDGKTKYLFFEWKNGDYVFGKMKPNYYVLVKE